MILNSRPERARGPRGWQVFGWAILLAWTAGCGGGPVQHTPQVLTTTQQVRKADSMVNAGRVKEALESIAAAVAADPDDARLRMHQGRILFQVGEYDKAAAAFEEALRLDPYYTDAHNRLGAAYAELGRKTEAEAEYRKALEDPAYPTPELTYLNLGLLYASGGRTDEAIDAFRKSVEINPRYFQAHYELASILDSSGNLEEAAREYEVAGAAYGDNGEFLYRLGFAYFRLGRKQEARETLGRVRVVAPGSHSAAQADTLLEKID